MKKIIIILLSVLCLLSLASCGKKKNNSTTAKGNNNNSNKTNNNYSGYKDKYDLLDTSYLPYKSEYSVELTNSPWSASKTDIEISRIDYESKKKYEEEILNYVKHFGVSSFRLPNAYHYETDYIFGGIEISGIQESLTDYYSYLDEVFKDFTKEYMNYEGLGAIAKELGMSGLQTEYTEQISIDKYSFDFSLETKYVKKLDKLTYKVSVSMRNDYLNISVSPSDEKYWTYEGQMGSTFSLPFFEELNAVGPYKLTIKGVTQKYVDREFVPAEYENHIYFMDDGSVYMETDASSYQNLFYQRIGNTFKKYYVREDTSLFEASEEFTQRRFTDDFAHFADWRQTGYTGVCRQLSSVYREKSEMLEYYDGYESLGYEIYDDKLCLRLKSASSGLFRCEYPHEIILDVETGYILSYIIKDSRYDEAAKAQIDTTASIDYGSFTYSIDAENKIAVFENIPDSTVTVTFKDDNNNTIKEETIPIYGGVIPPADQVKEGYDFLGWDGNYSKVNKDIVIKPIFKARPEYTVIFNDVDGKEIKRETVLERDSVEAPDYTPSEGVFYGWDADTSCVKSNLTVNPIILEDSVYTVNFYDLEDNLLKSERVNEGESATPPEAPKVKGYTFKYWDGIYNEVYYDTNVYAIYSKDDIDAPFGSISYFVEYHLQKLESFKTDEERFDYMIELGDNLAIASSNSVISKSLLNEGKAVAMIYPHAHILNSYGALLVKAGYNQNAIEYFENAIKLDPYNEVYYINLAEMLYADEMVRGRKDFEHVYFLINEALKYNQCYGPALQLKTTVMLEEGLVDESVEWLIASAKYVWNETSLHQFNSLMDEISRGYDKACSKADRESTQDEYIIDFKNPIEPYLDELLEIVAMQKGSSDCEGVEINGAYPVYVPVSAFPQNVDNFINLCDEVESNLAKAMASINNKTVATYSGDSGDEVGLVDSRSFMISKLIADYYRQMLEISLNKYSKYGSSDIENYFEHADGPKVSGLLASMAGASELPEDQALDKLEDVLAPYIDHPIQFKKDWLSSFEDLLNQWVEIAERDAAYIDNIKREAYNSFIVDVYAQAYYDVTYCASALYNTSLQNYMIAKAYSFVVDVYNVTLGWAAGIAADMAFIQTCSEACINLGYSMLLGTDRQGSNYVQDKKPEAMKPEKPRKSGADVAFGVNVSLLIFSAGVNYSMDGRGELYFDSPFYSKTLSHDYVTGQRTSTTLYYGTTAGNEAILGEARGRIQDTLIGSKIDCYSDIMWVSTDTRLGYGTQVTRNAQGKIIEDAKIASLTTSVNWGGKGGIDVTNLYKKNSITSAVSLDSVKINSTYFGITTSFSQSMD